ncbi:MAG: chitobiase/beta-hexosaminidase C-terminal domain-containing protein [Terracidiphilus sp.]
MSLGDDASLNGFVPFPATNAWNTNIAAAPVDPNSAVIVAAAGFEGLATHVNFGSSPSDGGIPYVVVDSTETPSVPIDVVAYADQSDVVVAPFPITAPIEGSPADCTGGPGNYVGDAHVLVLDRAKCWLYETFNTRRCDGQWSSDSETIWDMTNYESRPWGWTSADAAGLPVFPGLVRYDEVASGAIHHAIRFTLRDTKDDANGGYFVTPASHASGNYWGVRNVMGMRIRLKASFDISGYSKTNQVILTAMKQYGMILADNGGDFYLQGTTDSRWNDSDLANLNGIASSNFEVVQMTPAYPGYDSATAPTGPAPTISSFQASAATVAAGAPVTFTYGASGDSYDFIDQIGPVKAGSGSVTIDPASTETYTLNSTNAYGRTTSTPVQVAVSGQAAAALPTFNPPAGTYTAAQSVVLNDTTPGATIYYTTGGATPPTTSSTPYTGAISVSSSETLQAIAAAAGYANSSVASATYTINLPTPDFSLSISPASVVIQPGGNGTTRVTVTPRNGFSSVVSFRCSGLPSGASCGFSPAAVTPSGAAAATTLTVTAAASASAASQDGRPLVPLAALAGLLCCFGWKSRRRLWFLLLLLAVLGSGLTLAGCGSGSAGSPTPPTSLTTVTVTATSDSLAHSATFTLTLN